MNPSSRVSVTERHPWPERVPRQGGQRRAISRSSPSPRVELEGVTMGAAASTTCSDIRLQGSRRDGRGPCRLPLGEAEQIHAHPPTNRTDASWTRSSATARSPVSRCRAGWRRAPAPVLRGAPAPDCPSAVALGNGQTANSTGIVNLDALRSQAGRPSPRCRRRPDRPRRRRPRHPRAGTLPTTRSRRPRRHAPRPLHTC
jgi:hypothetical protein